MDVNLILNIIRQHIKVFQGDIMKNEIPPKKVTVIPPTRQPLKRVAIYCRVSTTHESQDESLDIQIKTLKQVVENNPKWRLYEIYSDKDSGGKCSTLWIPEIDL